MTLGKKAVGRGLVIVSTLVIFNLILYGVLPPAQPRPDITHAQQTRRAAESAGILAGFQDFDADVTDAAWYAPEPPDPLDGAVYQYMAQTDAPLTLTVGCSAPWTIEIVVMDRIQSLARPAVSVSVNGVSLPLTQDHIFRRQRYQAVITDGVAGDWRVNLSIPDLMRPSDLFATGENRLLGAAVDWVMVTGTACR